MKDKILKFQIISCVFVIILGTLLHFTYGWSGNNSIIASISSVNESTWEHLKLIFFPMLLTTIVGYFYFDKSTNNLLCSKLIGTVSAILFIIVFFYTYTGILGFNLSILDIGSFFVAVILGEYISYKLLLSDKSCNSKIAILIWLLLLTCFIVFTYVTPQIGLFRASITGGFGIL